MSDPQEEYARALVAYRRARKRLAEAKSALPKVKAVHRDYTLARIDALFPPSPVMMTFHAVRNRVDT
jgi:hypothetical protein